jgi:hypothetical protein
MDEQRRKKLTITTRKAKDFKTFPAEGAIGGVTPSQMYQINFYVEAPNIPDEITHELSENGKLGPQVGHKLSGGDVIRELQCAMVMTIPQAESLARWILTTVKNHREGDKNEPGVVM